MALDYCWEHCSELRRKEVDSAAAWTALHEQCTVRYSGIPISQGNAEALDR